MLQLGRLGGQAPHLGRQARGPKNAKIPFKQISPYFDHLGASRAPKIFLRAWVVGEGVPKGSPDFVRIFLNFHIFE